MGLRQDDLELMQAWVTKESEYGGEEGERRIERHTDRHGERISTNKV